MIRFLISSLLILVGFAGTAAAADVVASDGWVRMPPPVADTAAAYLKLTNHASKAVTVRSASSDCSEKVEFHSMQMMGGMMHMMEIKKVEIAAHGEREFSAGGDHIMLVGLTRKLNAGDTVKLKIALSDGSVLDIELQVRDMRKDSGHGHGSMSHGDMHHH